MKLFECHALTKRFGSTTAVDNVSFELTSGQPIALIGPNGSGKTTLLSLICGFIKPTSGELNVMGQKPGSRSLVGQLSVLPQDALFDPRQSVGQQLTLFARLQGLNRKQARSEVLRVLELVDLRESLRSKSTELSHGMRKRIAIAQAIMGSPQWVLLDEPTAGIDPPNAKMIRDLVKELSAHTSFIVSSHNLDELERLCETVVYLDSGKLISVGPVADDDNHEFLTLRLNKIPEAEFLTAVDRIPSIASIQKSSQGDFHIKTLDDMQASADLMQLLMQNGWRYRQLSRGKSLEERLYGN